MADENQNRRGPDLAEPRQFDAGGFGTAPAPQLPAVMGAGAGMVVQTIDTQIVAQKVVAPRNMDTIIRQLGQLCAQFGDSYVYSWEVNDRRNQRKTTIEGPTIKLANALARTYGNCAIDVRAMDQGSHWIFYARFCDLEKGFQTVRAFSQRKNQSTGMSDRRGGTAAADREADIIFQIGQSKAIRNVVVNALSDLAEWMVEESNKNLLGWVEGNADKARAYVQKIVTENAIPLKTVEGVIGRTFEKWTARDLARVLKEMRSVEEGLVDPEDLYPAPETIDQTKAAAAREKPAPSGGRVAQSVERGTENPEVGGSTPPPPTTAKPGDVQDQDAPPPKDGPTPEEVAEKQAAMEREQGPAPRKGPGRPPGSTNKPKAAAGAEEKPAESEAPAAPAPKPAPAPEPDPEPTEEAGEDDGDSIPADQFDFE